MSALTGGLFTQAAIICRRFVHSDVQTPLSVVSTGPSLWGLSADFFPARCSTSEKRCVNWGLFGVVLCLGVRWCPRSSRQNQQAGEGAGAQREMGRMLRGTLLEMSSLPRLKIPSMNKFPPSRESRGGVPPMCPTFWNLHRTAGSGSRGGDPAGVPPRVQRPCPVPGLLQTNHLWCPLAPTTSPRGSILVPISQTGARGSEAYSARVRGGLGCGDLALDQDWQTGASHKPLMPF